MIQRYYLPIESLERYAPKVRLSLIRRYHALYTQKYRWFVRPLSERAYYCDGERPNEIGEEIFDCDWTPNQWNTRPYRHFYNPVQDAWYESYARYGLPSLAEYDYGHTREDYLITRNGEPWRYFYSENGMWAWWFPHDKTLEVVNNGFYTRAHVDGTFNQGRFSEVYSEKPSKSVDTAPVMAVARKMNAKKFDGAYQPVIDRLVEVFNLNETQI